MLSFLLKNSMQWIKANLTTNLLTNKTPHNKVEKTDD